MKILKDGIKILAAFDGSEYSKRALNESVDIAREFRGSVTACHVYLDRRDDYSDELEALEPSLKETGVDYELRSVQQIYNFPENSPPRVIVRMAEEEGFDLISIGVRGVGGAKAWLVGSVAHEVLSKANCPVLVSKAGTRDFKKGSKILVPYDGSPDAKKALEEAVDIAKRFSNPITVLHVYYEPEFAPSLAESKSQKMLSDAEPVLKGSGVRYDIRSERDANVPAAINRIADDEGYDLVSMGCRGFDAAKAWMVGSVSGRVIADVGCSVLAF